MIVKVEHGNVVLPEALKDDELTIIPEFEEAAEGTTVRLNLIPGATMKDLRVPVEIPKCLAESMSEMSFSEDNYVVIKDDPLMVWTFYNAARCRGIKVATRKMKDGLRVWRLKD